jgi:hypothetical protein
VRSIASERLRWPSIMFSHVGEFASSKSDMNTFAPQLSALITIFRSVGPVISTRRSVRSTGAGGTRQSPSRTLTVSSRKSGNSPSRSRRARAARAASTSSRPFPSSRCSRCRNSTASGVRTSSALIGGPPGGNVGANARGWTHPRARSDGTRESDGPRGAARPSPARGRPRCLVVRTRGASTRRTRPAPPTAPRSRRRSDLRRATTAAKLIVLSSCDRR